MISADIVCEQCNHTFRGEVPEMEISRTVYLGGETLQKLTQHHLETRQTGSNGHTEFTAFLNGGEME